MFQSENNAHSTQRHHHEEDEEEECRVCRGPAEEGRPLFKPCKCSGSIGLTHQDCLTSWLEVKAGSGKCDLCQYTFQFAPQYASDAPETLSVLEVLMELRLKVLYDWIPFAIRCVFVCFIWFGVMPLCTAYIYQGWMHRPSSVIGRMTWDLVGSDLVNGCLLTVINVVGFLSIMSLAEFLRLQWNKLGTITTEKEEEELNESNVLIQEDVLEDDYKNELQKSPKRKKDPNEIRKWWTRQRNRMENGLPHGVAYRRLEAMEPLANTVSVKAPPNYRAADTKYPLKRVGHKEANYRAADTKYPLKRVGHNENNYRAADTKYPSKIDCFEEEQSSDSKDSLQRVGHEEKNNRYSHTKYPFQISLFEEDDDDDDDEDYVDDESNDDDSDDDDSDDDDSDDESDDESAIERMMQIQDEDNSGSDSDSENAIQNNVHLNVREDIREIEANLLNIQQGLANENLPNERMDALDGEMAMEFGILIGLQGPISHVFRNLTWILAFQTTFIFLFGCIPRIVGSISYSIFSKNVLLGNLTKFFATKALYLTFGLQTRDGTSIDWIQTVKIMNEENDRLQTLIQPRDVSLIVFGYLTYALLSFLFIGAMSLYFKIFGHPDSNMDMVDRWNRAHPNDMNVDEIKAYLLKTMVTASDCAAASSKISILVCFKMFVLPLILGIWLDLSTLQLFETNIEDRLTSAGADLIGAFLLHWVVGITFMLTVTVSILQLREVLHPDLLASIIRPQEPQPDLLLQLLQDSGLVHLKRMIPSVAIYASLMYIHVWLPCRLLQSFGIHHIIPFFHPKFCHIINPGLQSAIELLSFHLGILSILEKQKNAIGLFQHKLLMKLSSWFGMTKSLLPFGTSKSFALVGEIQLRGIHDKDHTDPAIHDQNQELLLTLSELHKKKGASDLYLESKVKLEEPSEHTKRAENIVTPDSYIIISSDYHSRQLMPTHMGKYRFRKRLGLKGRETIEIWREEATEPIPRPPEDWDYLADDNSAEKGRWAWGKKEKKSEIERTVASRDLLFPPIQKNGVLLPPLRSFQGLLKGLPIVLKLASVGMVSWIVATVISSIILFGPLILGRSIAHVLHFPDEYIHDPFLFFIGCILAAPGIVSITKGISIKKKMPKKYSQFSFPPFKKQLILFETLFLWLFLIPIFFGVLYETLFMKESLAALIEAKLFLMLKSWRVGFLLLHLMGAALYYGAFRRQFWYSVRTLAVEGVAGGRPGGANRNLAANRPPVANNNIELEYEGGRDRCINPKDEWQGDDGRVGIFLHCIHSALWMREWDRMDKEILLSRTLYPILHGILKATVIPMAMFLFTTISFGTGVFMYHASVIFVALYEICNTAREPLQKVARELHKSARDHKYLIGKILLNYEDHHNVSK